MADRDSATSGSFFFNGIRPTLYSSHGAWKVLNLVNPPPPRQGTAEIVVGISLRDTRGSNDIQRGARSPLLYRTEPPRRAVTIYRSEVKLFSAKWPFRVMRFIESDFIEDERGTSKRQRFYTAYTQIARVI